MASKAILKTDTKNELQLLMNQPHLVDRCDYIKELSNNKHIINFDEEDVLDELCSIEGLEVLSITFKE